MNGFSPARRIAAEALGTAFLLAVIVGSGIMGERLALGNEAIALLVNALATGAGLVVLIMALGPISGAHFNPVVTLWFAARRALSWRLAVGYVATQLIAALLGVALAHLMFEEPLYAASTHIRTGAAQWLAEFVATFGLLLTIQGTLQSRPAAVPVAVGLFIAAGYWFTASTSFANPAVTVARALTNSFSGIRPVDVSAFVLAQGLGAAAAGWFCGWLWSPGKRSAAVG